MRHAKLILSCKQSNGGNEGVFVRYKRSDISRCHVALRALRPWKKRNQRLERTYRLHTGASYNYEDDVGITQFSNYGEQLFSHRRCDFLFFLLLSFLSTLLSSLFSSSSSSSSSISGRRMSHAAASLIRLCLISRQWQKRNAEVKERQAERSQEVVRHGNSVSTYIYIYIYLIR